MGFLGGLLSATSENVADLACVGKCCSPSCCQMSLANTPWKVWFSTGSKSYIYIHIRFLDAFFGG
jgi:hypothetical protein